MLIPIRCFTCNKVIANKWISYGDLIRNGTTPAAALDELRMTRDCCRRMFLTQEDASFAMLQGIGVPVKIHPSSSLHNETSLKVAESHP